MNELYKRITDVAWCIEAIGNSISENQISEDSKERNKALKEQCALRDSVKSQLEAIKFIVKDSDEGTIHCDIAKGIDELLSKNQTPSKSEYPIRKLKDNHFNIVPAFTISQHESRVEEDVAEGRLNRIYDVLSEQYVQALLNRYK